MPFFSLFTFLSLALGVSTALVTHFVLVAGELILQTLNGLVLVVDEAGEVGLHLPVAFLLATAYDFVLFFQQQDLVLERTVDRLQLYLTSTHLIIT